MGKAIEALEDSLLKGNARHGGNPILTMCMMNAAIKEDPARNRKFDKRRDKERIDLAVALAMSYGAPKMEYDKPKPPPMIWIT